MIQTGSRSRRLLARPLAWIALLAILWAACAPLLMQMAPQRHAPLALSVDYCTEQGTATVQLPLLLADAGQADEQDGHGAHHDGLALAGARDFLSSSLLRCPGVAACLDRRAAAR
ncbi:DUF2946 family protein, partial [Bordetella pertussis]|uniref:DUF2946 family protein n=1 Tax=Bordetella pertussis TaxID=520 RepID=UPI000A77CB29